MMDWYIVLFKFKGGHRRTSLSIHPWWYWLSIYRRPFLSVRIGPFWFVHDWTPIGVNGRVA